MLGSRLVKTNRLTVVDGDVASSKGLLNPLFGYYQVTFSQGHSEADDRILKKWQVAANTDGTLLTDITLRPLNGYVPLYQKEDEYDDRLLESSRSEEKTLDLIDQIHAGEPKTFTHIALTAKVKNKTGKWYGTEAIGVLKADVDNLGMLMGCGLPEKRFTLSRMATLSRQLDSFFSIYLPDLLA
jgi:CRISPR-associated protein Csm1